MNRFGVSAFSPPSELPRSRGGPQREFRRTFDRPAVCRQCGWEGMAEWEQIGHDFEAFTCGSESCHALNVTEDGPTDELGLVEPHVDDGLEPPESYPRGVVA